MLNTMDGSPLLTRDLFLFLFLMCGEEPGKLSGLCFSELISNTYLHKEKGTITQNL